jgi:hypothetical protein
LQPCLKENVDKATAFDSNVELPFGWAGRAGDRFSDLGLWAWALTIVGWCLAGLAFMQGAPFWFDLLHRAVSFRSGDASRAH